VSDVRRVSDGVTRRERLLVANESSDYASLISPKGYARI
jgi:hypothetical protein